MIEWDVCGRLKPGSELKKHGSNVGAAVFHNPGVPDLMVDNMPLSSVDIPSPMTVQQQ